MKNFKNEIEILEYAKNLENKTSLEALNVQMDYNPKNKGQFGNFIEKEYFGIDNNNDRRPDFQKLGIELKVTPVKQLKNKTYSSKERMTLTMINYIKDYKFEFEESPLMKKLHILIIFYLWEKNLNPNYYRFLKSILYKIPSEDYETIREDYNIIMNKIRNGKAHELSEADTLYLSACTKGAKATTLATQKFSEIKAKQRAFAFKNRYMTNLFNNIYKSTDRIEKINKTKEEVSLSNLLNLKFNKYIGMSKNELIKEFNIESKRAKQERAIIIRKILGINKSSLSNVEEFQKANIVVKTILEEENNSIKEDMSFKNFKLKKIIEEKVFEESEWFKIFSETKFLFVIFKRKGETYYLDRIKLWNMPISDIEKDLRNVWQRTKNAIIEGVILSERGNKVFNNLPKKKENNIAHVRSKAKDGKDRDELPDGRMITKQCLFLSNYYIKKQIYDRKGMEDE